MSQKNRPYVIGAGKTGRMYYIAGEWDDEVTDRRTDELCPVVYYNNDYYYLKVDTNLDDEPGQASAWAKFDRFLAVFTDILFVKSFARFSKFVIAGDWLISVDGTIYDTGGSAHEIYANHGWGSYSENNAYTMFKSRYPNTSQPGVVNFCPNFAVDGKTGKTYQNDAYVRAQIVATGGSITGTLTVGTYSPETNSIQIVPSATNPSIVGFHGTTEVFRLSSYQYKDGTYTATLSLGQGFLRSDGLYIYGNGALGRLEPSGVMVEQVVDNQHYPVHLKVLDKKIRFGANGKEMWPTTKSSVSWGEVYVDGETLKVNMGG